MSRLLCTAAALLLAASSAGCVFYADDTGDDIICADEPAYEIRNPQTGQCEYDGGSGCYGADIAYPDWASCYTECEGLDEAGCLVTSGCRAAYEDSFTDCGPEGSDCGGSREFLGCWGTAPSGPVQGECWGLDAHECSRHDDCAAVYGVEWAGDDGTAHYFASCEPEPWSLGCYSDEECPGGYECTADTECLPPPGCEAGGDCPDVCYGRCVPSNDCELLDCGPGYHCELQCRPCDEPGPDGSCDDSSCEVACVPDAPACDDGTVCPDGTHCETRCEACDPRTGESCPEYCWTECVPDGTDPGECDGDVWCDSLPPSCPDGSVPGISDGCWSGYCIPIADCGPNDPGVCEGEVACDMAPPACPEGTTPGIRDACYTGYCIPLWACDGDRSCEAIGSEAECAARADCQAVYEGSGCTCYPDGTCSCDELAYSHCESAGAETPGG